MRIPSLLLAFFTVYLPIAAPQPVETPALQRLRSQLETLANDSLARHGLVSFSVQSTKTGAFLLEMNSRKSATPASTLKLVTTATALAILGENFTFETRLEYSGEIRQGVLHGNLYIRGSGDPTLGSDRFDDYPSLPDLMKRWVQRVKTAGIRQIDGAVVADASRFEENALPDTWVWGDMGNYYGAAAYGLNINENLYKVFFQPGKTIGSATRVLRTEPNVPQLEFINRVTTGAAGSGDQCYVYGAPYQPMQYLEGTIPAGVAAFPVRGSLPDPPFFSAFSLHHQLKAGGISVRDAATTDRLIRKRGQSLPSQRTVIDTYRSPPLSAIAKETNFQSLNLYAEALSKTLAWYVEPAPSTLTGTTEMGTEAIQAYWKKRGLDTEGWWMKDGSGLSPKDGIAAAQMTDLLRITATDTTFRAFYASIPVMGVSGTVKNLGKGTKAGNNVRAKSGSIERVRSYAGYFTSQSGELMSFAFFVNNYDGSDNRVARQMEAILVAMVEL